MYFFNRTFNYWRYLPHCWLIVTITVWSSLSGYHIILDPAGDHKKVGRTLATCYERSITLQLCEALKKELAHTYPNCTITITHTIGESLNQEQRAQIANKSNANFFIHISCFEDTSIKPQIMSYYYMQSNIVSYKPTPYSLIPADKAHEIHYATTKKLVHQIYSSLQKQNSIYTIIPPHAIPDARLKYIQIPSCTLEIGISRTFPWTTCVNPLCKALAACIEGIQ